MSDNSDDGNQSDLMEYLTDPEGLESPPSSSKKSERTKRKYKPEWKIAFPWHEYDENTNTITCRYCPDFKHGGIVNRKLKELRRNTLNKHRKSKGHQEAIATAQGTYH